MKSMESGEEMVFQLPKTPLPREHAFTGIGRFTRRLFFTPMEILRPAVGKPYAVMQANIRHRSQIAPYLRAFIDSAAPGLILAISEDVQQRFGVCVEEAAYTAARLMEGFNESRDKNRGPPKRVAFQFDHAKKYESVERALRAGVSGVMYDPSEGGRKAITIEDNIQLSKKFVKLSRRYLASAELEVGVIPGMEGAKQAEFSDPSAVATLVRAYPDVSVAVSVGNEHYRLSPKGRGLQFELFKRIRKAVPETPLVLHGGTGVSEADLSSSIIHLLLDKLNVGTEFLSQVLIYVAQARNMPRPTREQLRNNVFCRDLLFYLDMYPQKYLDEAQEAVYRSASAKLDFLTKNY